MSQCLLCETGPALPRWSGTFCTRECALEWGLVNAPTVLPALRAALDALTDGEARKAVLDALMLAGGSTWHQKQERERAG